MEVADGFQEIHRTLYRVIDDNLFMPIISPLKWRVFPLHKYL